MSAAPDISVVLGVYNSATDLARTLTSILQQQMVSLEVVVVDDGSSDDSLNIARNFQAKDARVRVLGQTNQGLTKALIAGCNSAQGNYIARHDAGGDFSHPQRLCKQLAQFQQSPGISVVSAHVAYETRMGKPLFEVCDTDAELTAGLLATELAAIKLPVGPASMFPRQLYEQVGGYRPSFYYAQDADLWLRLINHGAVAVVPELLYTMCWESGSISGSRRPTQLALREVAWRARMGLYPSTVACEQQAAQVSLQSRQPLGRWQQAQALYSSAALVAPRDPQQARALFSQSLKLNPMQPKAWVKWLKGYSA